MKTIFIVSGIVIGIAAVALIVVLLAASKVNEAHGRALYASFGSWRRIQEFAAAQGKPHEIAEADKTLAMIWHDLEQWRAIALSSGRNMSVFERIEAEAYETTDKNIKNGQNPLLFLNLP